MPVQRTSVESYQIKLQNLSHSQQRVLAAFKSYGPATNRNISERAHIPINEVTPRCGELRKKGLIEFCGYDYTGRTRAMRWEAVYPRDLF